MTTIKYIKDGRRCKEEVANKHATKRIAKLSKRVAIINVKVYNDKEVY